MIEGCDSKPCSYLHVKIRKHPGNTRLRYERLPDQLMVPLGSKGGQNPGEPAYILSHTGQNRHSFELSFLPIYFPYGKFQVDIQFIDRKITENFLNALAKRSHQITGIMHKKTRCHYPFHRICDILPTFDILEKLIVDSGGAIQNSAPTFLFGDAFSNCRVKIFL